jgi:RNA polymerase sigma-70 factor (ECF subfamily)
MNGINVEDGREVIAQIKRSKGVLLLNRKKSSDEELVKAFLEDRDEDAINEIVNRYANRIYRIALRITRNHSDAEGVLQKVFITLIEKLDAFREESKFSTWLYGVAVNASYAHLRTERKYKSDVSLEDYVSYVEDGVLKGVEIMDWGDRPDEVPFSKEAMEIIEMAANERPTRYRTVFHLRDVEGFSNEEAAKTLGLSLSNVKSGIHRARLYLRDRLLDYFYEWRK